MEALQVHPTDVSKLLIGRYLFEIEFYPSYKTISINNLLKKYKTGRKATFIQDFWTHFQKMLNKRGTVLEFQ